MNRLLCASLLLASLGPVAAQTAEARVHHEAKVSLDAFGHGYAAALLGNALPATQLEAKYAKPRAVKLAQGELSLSGTATDKDLAVTELKLTRGNFPTLGLQIGVTPVEALLRDYGPPEKREGRRLVYRGIAEICVDHLVFHIGNGVLQGIEWDWCSD
ncbi:MAG: hypothetical protein EKK52_14975 [Burkholderiales bacterium]|uniref:hypothetical protein n=1 Tax=Roseateles sp. TaxID=1971397 RepID=UPI000FB2AFE1|nr:MAG: hypothetical protein EKK52_14975 [Burkholderiales bacterium]